MSKLRRWCAPWGLLPFALLALLGLACTLLAGRSAFAWYLPTWNVVSALPREGGVAAALLGGFVILFYARRIRPRTLLGLASHPRSRELMAMRLGIQSGAALFLGLLLGIAGIASAVGARAVAGSPNVVQMLIDTVAIPLVVTLAVLIGQLAPLIAYPLWFVVAVPLSPVTGANVSYADPRVLLLLAWGNVEPSPGWSTTTSGLTIRACIFLAVLALLLSLMQLAFRNAVLPSRHAILAVAVAAVVTGGAIGVAAWAHPQAITVDTSARPICDGPTGSQTCVDSSHPDFLALATRARKRVQALTGQSPLATGLVVDYSAPTAVQSSEDYIQLSATDNAATRDSLANYWTTELSEYATGTEACVTRISDEMGGNGIVPEALATSTELQEFVAQQLAVRAQGGSGLSVEAHFDGGAGDNAVGDAEIRLAHTSDTELSHWFAAHTDAIGSCRLQPKDLPHAN